MRKNVTDLLHISNACFILGKVRKAYQKMAWCAIDITDVQQVSYIFPQKWKIVKEISLSSSLHLLLISNKSSNKVSVWNPLPQWILVELPLAFRPSIGIQVKVNCIVDAKYVTLIKSTKIPNWAYIHILFIFISSIRCIKILNSSASLPPYILL